MGKKIIITYKNGVSCSNGTLFMSIDKKNGIKSKIIFVKKKKKRFKSNI